MGDNKKWFKTWGAILVDQEHSNLSLLEVGRWTRLMAHMVISGERGKLKILPPAKAFLLSLELSSLDEAKEALKRLPNVSIFDLNNDPSLNRNNQKWRLRERDNGQIGGVTSVAADDNGSFIVIIKNWFKYQVDPTASERVKRSRYKRRGEEKRSLTSPSPTPSATPSAPLGGATATREKGRETALVGPTPQAPPPATRIENEEPVEFGHGDFLKIGWRQSSQPTDEFAWDALARSLTQEERVRSKLREKLQKDRQWG